MLSFRNIDIVKNPNYLYTLLVYLFPAIVLDETNEEDRMIAYPEWLKLEKGEGWWRSGIWVGVAKNSSISWKRKEVRASFTLWVNNEDSKNRDLHEKKGKQYMLYFGSQIIKKKGKQNMLYFESQIIKKERET